MAYRRPSRLETVRTFRFDPDVLRARRLHARSRDLLSFVRAVFLQVSRRALPAAHARLFERKSRRVSFLSDDQVRVYLLFAALLALLLIVAFRSGN
jgi:hypothetical protein